MALASGISLGTCTNLRDVGGSRTASGRILKRRLLYRSDSLHRLTDLEASALKASISPRTVVDLRTREEVDHNGGCPHMLNAHSLHLPVASTAPGTVWPDDLAKPSLLDLYVAMTAHSGQVIAEIVRVLGKKDALPAIVYCAAGKDRTGVVMALVLGALNVIDEDIVNDYAATPVVDPHLLGADYAERFERLPSDYRLAVPQTMHGFLAAMRRKYGSLRAYLALHGVSRTELRDLEHALLARD